MSAKTKHIQIGGMSESQYDLSTLHTIRDEGLGHYTVLFAGAWSNEQVQRVGAFCREHGFRFVMDERISRLTGQVRGRYEKFDGQELSGILNEYRDCCDGSLFMCEFGGLMLYWPPSTVQGSPLLISPTTDFQQAESAMLSTLRKLIQSSQADHVSRPLISIEASGMVAHWLYEAGIDRVDLEVIYDRHQELYLSAIKGATKAYGREGFGVDMAMVWYGGCSQHDTLWFERWRTSLLHALIRGADPIYAEHGLMDYKALGKDLSTSEPEVKKFRDQLGDVANVLSQHQRPRDLPLARIAVIQGHLDSFAGPFQTHLWGQRTNDAMRMGEAEASWQLFNAFYQRNPWEFRHVWGADDTSGNPPLGQVDVIPANTSLDVMQQYDCVLFLGWNSMTNDLYNRLTQYVKAGGHLLATLAHLNTTTQLNVPNDLIHHGDLSELFGVQVDQSQCHHLKQGIKFCQNPQKGAYQFPLRSQACDPDYCGGWPMAKLTLAGAQMIAVGSDRFMDAQWPDEEIVMTAHGYGEGQAMLINSLAYPGHAGLSHFYQDLLRIISAGWQGPLRVIASDRVRYATYSHDDGYLVYLLNTEPHLTGDVIIDEQHLSLRPGELTTVYYRDTYIQQIESLTH